MEVWLHAFSFPGKVAALARRAEEWGFAGVLLADSQNLNADIWVELGLAAAATTRLRLGPGVTNSVTHHLAVTASAASTLQAETAGRATLGFGRGDSALAEIGRRPVPVAEFERSLELLQAYLRGEAVDIGGTASAIRWLADSGLAKVPVHVAATGQRTIEAAARHAEGVDLAVGAELERLRSATGVALKAAPESLQMGAYLNVGVDADIAAAAELCRGNVAIFAGFAAGGPPGAAGTQRIDAEFIERFAVVGPPGLVRERLVAIADAGIERLIIVPGSLDADPGAVEESNARFASEVLPHLIG